MSTDAHPAMPKIDDLLAFNQQLVTLIHAGLPVELGDGLPSESVVEQLAEINSRIALQVSRGQTVDQAMAADTGVPRAYRAAWETWFHGSQPIEALNALTSQAEARREMRVNVGNAMIQPLVLLGLVYFGFIYLVLFAARQMELTYEQIHEPLSMSLRFLTLARDWLPVWGILLPLAVLLAILYWLKNSSDWNYQWLPGRKRFLEAIAKANYADNVARLLETDHPLSETLRLVGPLDDKAPLPAMLRWAVSAEVEGASRANLIRFISRTYRDAANCEIVRWRSWLPVLVGVALGGVLVLGYGLSLFTPMIELLKTLTRP